MSRINLYFSLLNDTVIEMSKQMAPLSIRLTPDQKKRLEDSAARIGISPHGLAQLAIQAGIEAIESNESLVLPIKFAVTQVAVPQSLPRTSYDSPALNETAPIREQPPKPRVKKSKAA